MARKRKKKKRNTSVIKKKDPVTRKVEKKIETESSESTEKKVLDVQVASSDDKSSSGIVSGTLPVVSGTLEISGSGNNVEDLGVVSQSYGVNSGSLVGLTSGEIQLEPHKPLNIDFGSSSSSSSKIMIDNDVGKIKTPDKNNDNSVPSVSLEDMPTEPLSVEHQNASDGNTSASSETEKEKTQTNESVTKSKQAQKPSADKKNKSEKESGKSKSSKKRKRKNTLPQRNASGILPVVNPLTGSTPNNPQKVATDTKSESVPVQDPDKEEFKNVLKEEKDKSRKLHSELRNKITSVPSPFALVDKTDKTDKTDVKWESSAVSELPPPPEEPLPPPPPPEEVESAEPRLMSSKELRVVKNTGTTNNTSVGSSVVSGSMNIHTAESKPDSATPINPAELINVSSASVQSVSDKNTVSSVSTSSNEVRVNSEELNKVSDPESVPDKNAFSKFEEDFFEADLVPENDYSGLEQIFSKMEDEHQSKGGLLNSIKGMFISGSTSSKSSSSKNSGSKKSSARRSSKPKISTEQSAGESTSKSATTAKTTSKKTSKSSRKRRKKR